MSSLFDPNLFLDAEVEGQMSEKAERAPIGRYNWQVDKITITRWDPKEPGGEASHSIEFNCVASGTQKTPTGQTLQEVTGRPQVYARYKGWLDFVPGTTAFDLSKGKNVTLGAMRAAVGMNNAGQVFKIGMLKGQVFSADLTYRKEKDGDREFPELRNPGPMGEGVTL